MSFLSWLLVTHAPPKPNTRGRAPTCRSLLSKETKPGVLRPDTSLVLMVMAAFSWQRVFRRKGQVPG